MTLEQWYSKINSSLPRWFFEEELNQKAVIYGLAKVFYSLESDTDAHISETFIMQAVNSFLDEHGSERKVDRIDEELDTQYRVRVQNITNQSNKPAIKNIVDQLLMIGECTITEDYDSSLFMNREVFMNRGAIIIEPIENTFSIIIDRQIHAPYAFVNREYFCDRECFMSTIETSEYIFNLVVNAVNKAKAFGTLYRLIERVV